MKKLSDVDIMDITDPRNPRPIAEYDLNTRFPQIIQPELGTGASFFHDVVVKQFNGRFIMLPSKPVAPQVFQNPGAIAIVQQRPRPTPTPPR